MLIFDTHAHYNSERFDEDRDEVLRGLSAAGVRRAVNVSASWEDIGETLALIRRYPFLYGAVGVHPDHVGELTEERMCELARFAAEEKVVAIGEIGLDYYWMTETKEEQKYWFSRQLALAKEAGLPVIIHSRDAAQDTFDLMKSEHAGTTGGVIHCYSGSCEMAKEYVKLGYYLGIGGVVTFKNGKTLKEVVRKIPLSSLVLETDCPYLAPVPFRGKRNSSAYLPYVIAEIARLKSISEEEVAAVTYENARKMYGLTDGEA